MGSEVGFLHKNMFATAASCHRWKMTIFVFGKLWRSVANSRVESHRAFSQTPAANVWPGFGSLAQGNHISNIDKKTTYHPLLYLSGCGHLHTPADSLRRTCRCQNRKCILQTEREAAMLPHGQNHFHSSSVSLCTGDCRSEPVTTEECLHELTKKLVEEASKLDVMIKSVPLSRAEQMVLNLHYCGFSSEEISSIVTRHPKYFTSTTLVPCIQILLGQGLVKAHVVSIVQDFEPVTCLKQSKIESVINVFRSLGFYEKSFSQILATCPPLFLLTEKAITQRIRMLKELFTSADVVVVVRSNPHLLLDKWPDIEARFKYVFHEMKITQKQMVYASLFSHSLQHVKNRHTFLVRAGFFDMSKLRENEKSSNASLDKIIDTTDEEFCQKFGGLSSEEYKVFCKLFKKEDPLVESDEEQ